MEQLEHEYAHHIHDFDGQTGGSLSAAVALVTETLTLASRTPISQNEYEALLTALCAVYAIAAQVVRRSPKV